MLDLPAIRARLEALDKAEYAHEIEDAQRQLAADVPALLVEIARLELYIVGLEMRIVLPLAFNEKDE